jgi:hypothetical protein
MTNLVLERFFDTPLSVADMHRGTRRTKWCFDLYQVEWRGSLLSADGRTLVCRFAAPDAEAARNALRKVDADIRRLWTASVYEAPSTVLPNVLVERSFPAPETFERLKAIVEAKAWCLEQHRVEWARSFLSNDGRRMLCQYRAPDVESVRLAQREAGLPVDALWAFERISPEVTAESP